MLSGKRVVVSGGAGFIGSHLVSECLAGGAELVVVVDNFFLGSESNLPSQNGRVVTYRIDASDLSAMSSIVEKHKIDWIFDLAVIPLPTSLEFPNWTVQTNISIVGTMCELLRRQQIERLIHLSSSEAFGTALSVPMSEDHPLMPTTPYAASKASGDLIIESYVRTFGLDARVLRPFNNFGPHQNSGSYAGIIPIVVERIRTGRPVTIHGDGLQTRDFTFVGDTVQALVELALSDKFPAGKPINVATGEETSILDLISMIAIAMQAPQPKLEFEPERIGDVRRHCADTRLLEKTLGRSIPAISIERLAETADWYLSRP